MVFRSVYHPIFVGLGTAAILAAGAAASGAATMDSSAGVTASATASASASPSTSASATPSASQTPAPAGPSTPATPSPTPTTGTPAPVPKLFVALTEPGEKLHPGESAKVLLFAQATGAVASEMRLTFTTQPKITLTPQCVVENGSCTLKKVDGKGDWVRLTVKIPKKMKPGKFTITAVATDTVDKAAQVSDKQTYTVHGKPVKKPASKPADQPSSPGGGSPGGGSPGGKPSTGGAPGSAPAPGSAADIPPLPSPAAQAPEVALPPVAGPPVSSPSVAPQTVAAPQSSLRAGTGPASSELTFERLAGTQAAWLAALLATLALLLTQLRINRIAMGLRTRPKGDHRRPRKGVFGR